MPAPKKVPRGEKRRFNEKIKKQIELVKTALELGHVSRREICKAADMKPHELAYIFRENRDIYREYTIRRRTLVDTAADNIQEIINDPTHPSHFAASKFILQSYKSDLDNILEHHDSEKGFEFQVGGESKASPVNITFGEKKGGKKKEED